MEGQQKESNQEQSLLDSQQRGGHPSQQLQHLSYDEFAAQVLNFPREKQALQQRCTELEEKLALALDENRRLKALFAALDENIQASSGLLRENQALWKNDQSEKSASEGRRTNEVFANGNPHFGGEGPGNSQLINQNSTSGSGIGQGKEPETTIGSTGTVQGFILNFTGGSGVALKNGTENGEPFVNSGQSVQEEELEAQHLQNPNKNSNGIVVSSDNKKPTKRSSNDASNSKTATSKAVDCSHQDDRTSGKGNGCNGSFRTGAERDVSNNEDDDDDLIELKFVVPKKRARRQANQPSSATVFDRSAVSSLDGGTVERAIKQEPPSPPPSEAALAPMRTSTLLPNIISSSTTSMGSNSAVAGSVPGFLSTTMHSSAVGNLYYRYGKSEPSTLDSGEGRQQHQLEEGEIDDNNEEEEDSGNDGAMNGVSSSAPAHNVALQIHEKASEAAVKIVAPSTFEIINIIAATTVDNNNTNVQKKGSDVLSDTSRNAATDDNGVIPTTAREEKSGGDAENLISGEIDVGEKGGNKNADEGDEEVGGDEMVEIDTVEGDDDQGREGDSEEAGGDADGDASGGVGKEEDRMDYLVVGEEENSVADGNGAASKASDASVSSADFHTSKRNLVGKVEEEREEADDGAGDVELSADNNIELLRYCREVLIQAFASSSSSSNEAASESGCYNNVMEDGGGGGAQINGSAIEVFSSSHQSIAFPQQQHCSKAEKLPASGHQPISSTSTTVIPMGAAVSDSVQPLVGNQQQQSQKKQQQQEAQQKQQTQKEQKQQHLRLDYDYRGFWATTAGSNNNVSAGATKSTKQATAGDSATDKNAMAATFAKSTTTTNNNLSSSSVNIRGSTSSSPTAMTTATKSTSSSTSNYRFQQSGGYSRRREEKQRTTEKRDRNRNDSENKEKHREKPKERDGKTRNASSEKRESKRSSSSSTRASGGGGSGDNKHEKGGRRDTSSGVTEPQRRRRQKSPQSSSSASFNNSSNINNNDAVLAADREENEGGYVWRGGRAERIFGDSRSSNTLNNSRRGRRQRRFARNYANVSNSTNFNPSFYRGPLSNFNAFGYDVFNNPSPPYYSYQQDINYDNNSSYGYDPYNY